jgi:hypothetical protein
MTDQNLLMELAAFAEAGEHTKFQLLQNWKEYRITRKVRYSLVLLTNSLQSTADKQLKQYCRSVCVGSAEVRELLAYNAVINILKFYLAELDIIEGILEEYEAYLASGNWTDFVFGIQRPLDKRWDHRGE